jgi:hypothetical protein
MVDLNMAEEFEKKIKRMAKLFLENSSRMIKENDLVNLISSEESLEDTVADLNSRFEKIGYEIIKSKFLNDSYYILTSEGFNKALTPQMYGILAIIVTVNKDLGKDFTIEEANDIFSEMSQEIAFLKEQNYLVEIKANKEVKLIATPLAKVLFKNLIKELNVEVILRNLGIQSLDKIGE